MTRDVVVGASTRDRCEVAIKTGSVFDGLSSPRRTFPSGTIEVFLNGAWESAAAHCRQKGYSSIVVVSDPVITKLFGEYFSQCFGENVLVIDGPSAKSNGEHHRRAYNLGNADVVIALGGGTNIDQAKLFAKFNNIPWLALPTKPTAAILSSHASIVTDGVRASESTPLPQGVFIDQAAFPNLDPLCAQSEFGDSLSSLTAVADAYLSNLDRGTAVNKPLLRRAHEVARDTLRISDLRSSEGIAQLYRANLRYAEIMRSYGSSTPCSGTEHAISHALDSLGSKQLHGIQVGFTTLVGVHLQSSVPDLSRKLEREEIEQVPAEVLQAAMDAHGLPTRLSDLGISVERFEHALRVAPDIRGTKEKRYTVLDRYEVSEAISRLSAVGLVG